MIRIADDAEFFKDNERVPPINRPSINDAVVVEQNEVMFAFDYDGANFDECRDPDDAESFLYPDMDGDPAVSLEIEHARWYDPARGVWLSTDPIGYGEANFDVYPANDPTLQNDPDGL